MPPESEIAARTFAKNYGAAPRSKRRPKQMTQDLWRERGERKANVTRLFREAAGRRAAEAEPPRRRPADQKK